MVNRIFLHANKNSLNEQRRNSADKNQKVLLSAVVVLIAFVYSSPSSSSNLLIALEVLGVVVLSIQYLIAFIRRNEFQKAVIEITPFGVQLISIYGPGSSSSHDGINDNNRGQSTSSYGVTDTSSRSHNNIESTHSHHVHHGESSLHKTITSKRKVRAFIPRERILDVIVIEIVWPHCVWSQVAFRVDKGLYKSSPVVQSQHSEYKAQSSVNNDDHGNRRRQQPTSPKGDAYNHDNVTINGDEDHYATRSQNIQALLKQNRVAIVPAFPEECRGLLSYKECLLLQEEIEGLLGNIDT